MERFYKVAEHHSRSIDQCINEIGHGWVDVSRYEIHIQARYAKRLHYVAYMHSLWCLQTHFLNPFLTCYILTRCEVVYCETEREHLANRHILYAIHCYPSAHHFLIIKDGLLLCTATISIMLWLCIWDMHMINIQIVLLTLVIFEICTYNGGNTYSCLRREIAHQSEWYHYDYQ